MTASATLGVTAVLCMAIASSAAPASLKSFQWRRRIVLVSAAGPADSKAVLQRGVLNAWRDGATARDVSLVEVFGADVSGASDNAAAVRERYALQPGVFQVLLIGKDGHVALRSSTPITGETLERAIDAMPMRRAGER